MKFCRKFFEGKTPRIGLAVISGAAGLWLFGRPRLQPALPTFATVPSHLLARSDRPTLALARAERGARDSAERYRLVGAIVRDWICDDPEVAWHWVLQQANRLDVPDQPSLRTLALREMAVSDPAVLLVCVERAMIETNWPDAAQSGEIVHAAVLALIQDGSGKL